MVHRADGRAKPLRARGGAHYPGPHSAAAAKRSRARTAARRRRRASRTARCNPRWHRYVASPNSPQKGSAEDILSYAARDLFGMLKVNATAYPHLHDQSHQAVVDELQELGAFAGIDDAEIQRIMT